MAKKRVTSRLAKKQQKKLTKQTILLVVMSIIVVALFVFVVVPNVIRLFFKMIDSGSPFEQQDTIPPQPPMIQSPTDATSSAKLKISGYGEPEAEVVFVINNKEQDKEKIDQEGEFEALVKLNLGENELNLYSVDKAGNESLSRSFNILVDTQKPTIDLESPEDGQKFEDEQNRVIEVKGTTEAKAKVYLNGRMTTADSEGNFNHRYRLEEGENKLEIRAVDKAGNEEKTEITVEYED